MEIWKDIKDYEGHYKISNLGNVKNVKIGNHRYNKLLKPRILECKYYSVSLFKDNKGKEKFIHRLLAETFIPNPENKPEVNHIDGNKLNNDIDNLEWVTHKENLLKASEEGLLYNCGSEFRKIDKNIVNKIKEEYIPFYNSVKKLSKEYNLKTCKINQILKGKYDMKIKEKKDVFIKAYIPEDLHTKMRVYSARTKKVNNLIVIEALREFLKDKN